MVLTLKQKEQIRELHHQGKGHTEIADILDVDYDQVKRYRDRIKKGTWDTDPKVRFVEHPEFQTILEKVIKGASVQKIANRYNIPAKQIHNYINRNNIKVQIRYHGTLIKDGKRYQIEGRLIDFVRRYDLSISSVRLVLEGKQTQHRGFYNADNKTKTQD